MGPADTAPVTKRLAVLMLCHVKPAHALASIQSMHDERHLIEQVIVGDNSGDPAVTATLAASTLDFTHVVFDHNNGFAGGMNALLSEALASCDAEYFLVLNDDTELEPFCLTRLLAAAAPNHVTSPMVVAADDRRTVIQSAGDFDRDLVRFDNRFAGRDRSEVEPGIHEVELTDGCCFLIHRRWPESGMLFDPDFFLYFEDVDYFLRLRGHHVRFFFVADAVLRHHKSSSSAGLATSALREYYFCRNRFALANKLHTGTKRLRVLVVVGRLTLRNWWTFRTSIPAAARATRLGALHFVRGKRGAYPPAHEW